MKLLFWALKTVATLLFFCFFFTLFNKFIAGSVRQVIGTQQVWDVTVTKPSQHLMFNYNPIPVEIFFNSLTRPSI